MLSMYLATFKDVFLSATAGKTNPESELNVDMAPELKARNEDQEDLDHKDLQIKESSADTTSEQPRRRIVTDVDPSTVSVNIITESAVKVDVNPEMFERASSREAVGGSAAEPAVGTNDLMEESNHASMIRGREEDIMTLASKILELDVLKHEGNDLEVGEEMRKLFEYWKPSYESYKQNS